MDEVALPLIPFMTAYVARLKTLSKRCVTRHELPAITAHNLQWAAVARAHGASTCTERLPALYAHVMVCPACLPPLPAQQLGPV